jgi:hypothetical protein
MASINATEAMIAGAARQEMLSLPQLYGPNGLNTSMGYPTNLIVALQQLETPMVVPSLLTGSQTVDSVVAQTLSDLQSLAAATDGEVRIAGLGPVSESTVQVFAFNFLPSFQKATPLVVQDATVFAPAAAIPP